MQISYASSRNRQWHIYTVTERRNRHSLALKRVFLRCGQGRGRGSAGTERSQHSRHA